MPPQMHPQQAFVRISTFSVGHPYSLLSHSHRPLTFRTTTPRWRATVTAAGNSQPVPHEPDKKAQGEIDADRQPLNQVWGITPGEPHSDDTDDDVDITTKLDLPHNADQSHVLSKFHSLLGDSTVAIDPVKNVPVALIDASGALQLDDGSFSPAAVAPPLVRRARKKLLDLPTLRRQLAEGFDSGIGATVLLSFLFGTWYWSNTAFNVFNKQVLKVFPYPLTCTVVQFAVAGALMSLSWLFRLRPIPRINKFSINSIVPLGFLHAAGFLLTNMSLGKVSVAFTHTVKSTEPFFSAALTPKILGDIPTWGIVGSLFPIVGGVVIASATDASFNWPGFLSAIGSNVALQSRNILSKRLMNSNVSSSSTKRKKHNVESLSDQDLDTLATLDNINLFSTMSLVAFFILMPMSLLIEGIPLLTSATSPAVTGMPTRQLLRLLLTGGICRCLDVLASYMILKRVSPVTHSIGNCVKRAVVIVASIFFFQTKMTSLNIIGTALALLGVLCYSLILSACKLNTFGPDSPFCRPIYTEEEVELTEGGGI